MRLLPCFLLAALASAPTCGGDDARRDPPAPDAELELPADVRAAIEAELALVRAAPLDGARWRTLGELYEANGLPALAEQCYAVAVEREPREPRGWYHLARRRGERGAFPEALAAAARAAELAPDYGPIHWRSGEWLFALERVEEAQGAFARALEVDAGNPAARWGLARVALDRGEPAAALTALAPLEGARPDFAYTHHLRAIALRCLGEHAQAAREAERAGQPVWIDPWKADVEDRRGGFHGRLARVRAAVQAKELDEAARLLEEMRALEPDNVNVAGMLSDVYLSVGRARDAEAVLLATRARWPAHYRVAFNLANVHERTGELGRALAELDECLRLHPTLGLAHLRRGRVLASLGRDEAALTALEEARRVGESSPELQPLLGRSYARLARWSEAARAFEAALEQQPAVPLAILAAEAHARAGERDAAWRAYGRAESLEPGAARLSELRALLEAAVGERGEAVW